MGKKKNRNGPKIQQSDRNDPNAIQKNKHFEREQKEKDIVDKFEERQQAEKPAVTLKLERPKIEEPRNTSTPNQKSLEQKKKWRNDGQSAVHKPISQMISEMSNGTNGFGQQKSKASKRKNRESTESSTAGQNSTNSTDQNQSNGIVDGKSSKRRKIAGSNSSDSDETDIIQDSPSYKELSSMQNGNFDENEILFDDRDDDDDLEEEDEDEELSSLEDEDIDDLEDEELEMEDMTDLQNARMEDEEEEEVSSLFTSEDEMMEDEEEDEMSDVSAEEESFEFEYTGYESNLKSNKCLVLEARDDYTMATVPFKLFIFSQDVQHSVQVGLKALQWVIGPIDIQTFFSEIFQKRVVVVKRKAKDYFAGFFGKPDFLDMLQKFDMQFGKDVNVAVYEQGRRRTLNGPEGERADAATLWRHIMQGRSAQLVRPQLYNDNIWYLCEVLQEVFCSFVGANCYFTPSGSSGFAPHWDDIDAFIIQLEGKKYWKVYAPATMDDTLPLESSGNFTDQDFSKRQPTFEGWLDQGDTLYVPRGWIHQANTKDVHSLHVTVSVCRRHSFADFLEKASTVFIQNLVSASKQLRKTLPPLLLDMGGVTKQDYLGGDAFHDSMIPITEVIARKFGSDFSSYVHSYIDLMAREFFRTALPPMLSAQEKELMCFGTVPAVIDRKTEVRLVRKHAQRVLFEDDSKAFLVHRMHNSRQYEGVPEATIDFPTEYEDGFIMLTNCYPNWIRVAEMGKGGSKRVEEGVGLAKLLFEHGLLMARQAEEKEEEEGKGKKKMDAKEEEGKGQKKMEEKKKEKIKELDEGEEDKEEDEEEEKRKKETRKEKNRRKESRNKKQQEQAKQGH